MYPCPQCLTEIPSSALVGNAIGDAYWTNFWPGFGASLGEKYDRESAICPGCNARLIRLRIEGVIWSVLPPIDAI
jgi:hypothetical protein